MNITLKRVKGFNGCTGLWLFFVSDKLLVTLGFNKYHMDIQVLFGAKQLTLGPSIQFLYE